MNDHYEPVLNDPDLTIDWRGLVVGVLLGAGVGGALLALWLERR